MERKGGEKESYTDCHYYQLDLTFYEKLTHGDDCFRIGDAVELNSSGQQPSLIGDYKVSTKVT